MIWGPAALLRYGLPDSHDLPSLEVRGVPAVEGQRVLPQGHGVHRAEAQGGLRGGVRRWGCAGGPSGALLAAMCLPQGRLNLHVLEQLLHPGLGLTALRTYTQ